MKGSWGVLRNNRFIFYALIPYFFTLPILLILWNRLFYSRLWVYRRDTLVIAILVYRCLIFWKIFGRAGFFNASLWKRLWGEGTLFFVIGGMLFVLQMYLSPWPLVTSFMAIAVLTFGNGFYCR